MNTKDKGQITEGAVMFSLILKGKTVLVPYGENNPYDLVIDEGENGFKKVQCKTATLQNGVLIFNLYSVILDKETKKYKKVRYGNKIDYYGVYSPDLRKTYLIPVSVLPKTQGTLRVDDRQNNGGAKSKWAKDYEI